MCCNAIVPKLNIIGLHKPSFNKHFEDDKDDGGDDDDCYNNDDVVVVMQWQTIT